MEVPIRAMTFVGKYYGEHEIKMVLCVRQDLKMKPGKVAAQCSHATLGLYQKLERKNYGLVRRWQENGQPKVRCTPPPFVSFWWRQTAGRGGAGAGTDLSQDRQSG